MAKLAIAILIAIVVVLWFKHANRARVNKPKPPAPRQAEDMVRCAVCGVNLPRSEAILSRGDFYCCDEHRRQGRGGG